MLNIKNDKEYAWAIYSWRNIIKIQKIYFSKINNKFFWAEGYMKGKHISDQGLSSKIIVYNKDEIPNAIERLKRNRKELHEYYNKFNNIEYIVEAY